MAPTARRGTASSISSAPPSFAAQKGTLMWTRRFSLWISACVKRLTSSQIDRNLDTRNVRAGDQQIKYQFIFDETSLLGPTTRLTICRQYSTDSGPTRLQGLVPARLESSGSSASSFVKCLL